MPSVYYYGNRDMFWLLVKLAVKSARESVQWMVLRQPLFVGVLSSGVKRLDRQGFNGGNQLHPYRGERAGSGYYPNWKQGRSAAFSGYSQTYSRSRAVRTDRP